MAPKKAKAATVLEAALKRSSTTVVTESRKESAPQTLLPEIRPPPPQTSVPDLVGEQSQQSSELSAANVRRVSVEKKKEDVSSKRQNAAEIAAKNSSKRLHRSRSTSKTDDNSSKSDAVPTSLEVAEGVFDRLMDHKANVESRLPVIKSDYARRIKEFEDSIRVVVHLATIFQGKIRQYDLFHNKKKFTVP
uniref:Uncharacterized protein n=1 Tax=Panagrolaimus davidi TaxID=227884 RepID=A0A914QJJ6_9BILA